MCVSPNSSWRGDADHVRRPQHDEQRVLVELELRPLMRVVGVLDGEVVQAELLLHLPQHVLLGLVEPEPDELDRSRASAARICSMPTSATRTPPQ